MRSRGSPRMSRPIIAYGYDAPNEPLQRSPTPRTAPPAGYPSNSAFGSRPLLYGRKHYFNCDGWNFKLYWVEIDAVADHKERRI